MKYGRYDSVLLVRIDTKLKEQVRLLAYASKQSLASFTRRLLAAVVKGQFDELTKSKIATHGGGGLLGARRGRPRKERIE